MSKVCKFYGCIQNAMLTKDEDTISAQFTKNQKGEDKEYVGHFHSTKIKNGFCFYHDKFIDHKTMR